MEKLLLTPEEVANVLSIGRSKVYELMGCGALGSVRIGGSRRVSVEALNRFIDELGSPECLGRSA
jgi:excisionase family DNA binding protein